VHVGDAVIILDLYTKSGVRRTLKILLISSHGIKQPGDTDL